jgi:hypothetical protein
VNGGYVTSHRIASHRIGSHLVVVIIVGVVDTLPVEMSQGQTIVASAEAL